MMKSFFKKLAFVMALAMVVSMVAPAGAVFAAEVGISLQGGKTAVTEYALDVEESVDFAFVGYEGWKKGTPYTWESSDETVAVVDNGGIVTGLADGVATITVTVNGTWTQSVVVTVGTGKAADVNTPVVNSDFTVRQLSDEKVELVFADKTITKEAVEAGLSTYFVIFGTNVTYPVYYVDSVKDGVATVVSYVLFEDGVTYGFTYGGKSAEFTAVIGDVAYVTAMYKSENTNYAAYYGKDTKVIATLWNSKGIDITKSVKGTVQYTLVNEATNGEYWPSGAEGTFFFNTVGASATVKVTYMTGEYDEDYNQIAGPSTQVTLYSTNIPEYTIDQTASKTATIAIAPDWSNPTTVIALRDDNGAHKLVLKMKDNRGNTIYTNAANSEGTFSFQSTNDAILYVANDGTVMTNSVGEVSVLVKLKANGENTREKVVAVVPVTVAAQRKASTIDINQPAAVISTVDDYNDVTFYFTLKDQLKAKINAKYDANLEGDSFVVTCNNAANLPKGAASAPEVSDVERTGTGEYKVTITGIEGNLPENANGYTYTFTAKVDGWLTRTFNVTVRKPVIDSETKVEVVSGYKLEFTNRTDIKTMATTTAPTAIAFNNVATLYQLSNNVKFETADLEYKPSAVEEMKVDYFYYSISKNGVQLTDVDKANSLVNTVDGKIVIDLTKFEKIEEVNDTLNGNYEVKKNKLGAGNYTVVVYRGVGDNTASKGATASQFAQITSASLNVTDSQDTMVYVGRNGNNDITKQSEDPGLVKTLKSAVMTKFKFKIGDTTLDEAADYTAQKIEIVVNANTVATGTVAFINSVDFYKEVGVHADGKKVYVKYTVNVGDYVNIK